MRVASRKGEMQMLQLSKNICERARGAAPSSTFKEIARKMWRNRCAYEQYNNLRKVTSRSEENDIQE